MAVVALGVMALQGPAAGKQMIVITTLPMQTWLRMDPCLSVW
jgi:hypothetical protein